MAYLQCCNFDATKMVSQIDYDEINKLNFQENQLLHQLRNISP